jgi:hypothetical protein
VNGLEGVSEGWVILNGVIFTVCLSILRFEVPSHQAAEQDEKELSCNGTYLR